MKTERKTKPVIFQSNDSYFSQAIQTTNCFELILKIDYLHAVLKLILHLLQIILILIFISLIQSLIWWVELNDIILQQVNDTCIYWLACIACD